MTARRSRRCHWSLSAEDERDATQGDFATEDRLELHRSVWVGSFEKLDAVLKTRGG